MTLAGGLVLGLLWFWAVLTRASWFDGRITLFMLALCYLGMGWAARRPYYSARFGDLETFGDLARALADEQ